LLFHPQIAQIPRIRSLLSSREWGNAVKEVFVNGEFKRRKILKALGEEGTGRREEAGRTNGKMGFAPICRSAAPAFLVTG
jgi:hypothetical protein